MATPTAYTEATLAYYMVTTLGALAETLGLDESAMYEAVNDVTAECGVTDIADATDIGKVRALSKVAALRVAQTSAAGWYDFGADGGNYKRSQVMTQIDAMLQGAEAAAMLYGGAYAVGVGTMTFTNDPYVWTDDTNAAGVL